MISRSREIQNTLLEKFEQEFTDDFIATPCHLVMWNLRHPSGFGVVTSMVDGNVFMFNPNLIDETTAGWSHDQLQEYLDAIIDWWMASTLPMTMGYEVETAIERFAQEAPRSWLMFATHHQVQEGTPLVHWLGGIL